MISSQNLKFISFTFKEDISDLNTYTTNEEMIKMDIFSMVWILYIICCIEVSYAIHE